jgi:hypothetical protein
VDFEDAKLIDTIIVYTFPAFVNGRFWRGLKDFQVQYLDEGKSWVTLETVMDNSRDYYIVHFDEVKSSSIRIWVTRNHYPEEKGYETGFTAIDESPRIIEIEAYNLRNENILIEVKKHKDIEIGAKGNIAVLSDDSFQQAVSSVQEVAAFLRSSGYGVTLLDGDEVCVPELFNASNFDTYIHLQGKYMPLGMNLYDFLKEGGHLATFGGRAFTRVKQKIEGVWYDPDIDPEVTSSTGRYDDCIRPYREQLGIFTIPNSQLEYVQGARNSPGQNIIKQKIEIVGSVNGWMACGLVGEILETQGAVSVNGEEILNTSAHIMMTALDSKDLRNSNALLIYPVRSGKLELKNSNLNMVEVGELVGGLWQTYESIDTANNGTSIIFDISTQRSTSLILAYKIGERDNAVSMLHTALVG